MAIGKIAEENPALQKDIISILKRLLENPESKIRQSVINAAGEIGID